MKPHMLAEVKEGGKWVSPHTWTSRGPNKQPRTSFYNSAEWVDDAPLWGALGGPYAETLPPERSTLAGQDALPSTTCAATHAWVDQWGKLIEHTWVVRGRVLFGYPWTDVIVRSYQLDDDAFEHWKVTGVIPARAKQDDAPEGPHEVHVRIEPVDIWGKPWTNFTFPRLEGMRSKYEDLRLFFFLTEVNL